MTMIMERRMSPREQEEAKVTLQAEQWAHRLRSLTAIIRDARFQNWYLSSDSRFEWAKPCLFGKLNRKLEYQIESVNFRDFRDLESIPMLRAFAKVLDMTAERLEAFAGRNTRMTVKRGWLKSNSIDACLRETLATHDGPHSLPAIRTLPPTRWFYVSNALLEFRHFVQARRTLVENTGHRQFEEILKKVKIEWLMDGYPYDLLAHDAEDIRTRVPTDGLFIRDEFCSTVMCYKGTGADPENPPEDFRFVPLK